LLSTIALAALLAGLTTKAEATEGWYGRVDAGYSVDGQLTAFSTQLRQWNRRGSRKVVEESGSRSRAGRCRRRSPRQARWELFQKGREAVSTVALGHGPVALLGGDQTEVLRTAELPPV
jgi:hypothetical protein